MELEELFLKEEELPILGNLHKIFFQVPIHPKLLDTTLNIDKSIAQKLFPQVTEEWYEELKDYIPSSKEEIKWINGVFSKKNSREDWEQRVVFMDNGFVQRFSINFKENKDGALYFNKQELNYKSYALTFINFSEEKYKEFVSEKGGSNIFVYSQQNIDTFPKALFLRNWARLHMNEAFKQIF
jgi:hypothetical protein